MAQGLNGRIVCDGTYGDQLTRRALQKRAA